jgi:hypothetical protein
MKGREHLPHGRRVEAERSAFKNSGSIVLESSLFATVRPFSIRAEAALPETERCKADLAAVGRIKSFAQQREATA